MKRSTGGPADRVEEDLRPLDVRRHELDAPSWTIDFSTWDSAAAFTITSTSRTTSRDERPVPDIAVDEGQPLVSHHVGDVVDVPRVGQRVERDDVVRGRVEEIADEARRDEPGAAGHEDALAHGRRLYPRARPTLPPMPPGEPWVLEGTIPA